MSSRTLLAVGLILLVCCCCCQARDQETDPPSSSQAAIVAFANAPATETARASATAYTEMLLAVLRAELPSLVLLDTGVRDWCAPGECHLTTDYFFGTGLSGVDGDPLTSLTRIDAVLSRQSTNVLAGIDTVRTGQSSCPELRYELRRPEGTTNVGGDLIERAPAWTSKVIWVDTADTADTACAGRLRPAPAVPSGSVYQVRNKDVNVDGLLTGVLGEHRSIVQISVGGSYLARA